MRSNHEARGHDVLLQVKTRNKSLRSRADAIIRIKSAETELEDSGIVMFRFRLGTITCNEEIHTICYQ